MPLPSGLSTQLGLTIESTYGVLATPATFVPILQESLMGEVEPIESEGIIAGKRFLASEQWALGGVTVGGDVGMELYDRGIGKLFRLIFGGIATTGSGPYTHTFTPGTSLPSATVQVGRTANDGTAYPANYTGMKVASWEIAAKVGEIVTLGLTFVGQNEQIGSRTVTDGATTNTDATVTSSTGAFTTADIGKTVAGTGIPAGATIASINSATSVEISANATATATGLTIVIGTALASASYASGQLPFYYKGATLSLGGSNAYATEITIKGENGLSDARTILGSDLTREHLLAGEAMVTADIKAEFDGITDWTNYRKGAEVAVSLACAAPSGTNTATISGNARIDKATTNASGKGILEKDLSVKFLRSGSAESTAIQAVLVNGDSTP